MKYITLVSILVIMFFVFSGSKNVNNAYNKINLQQINLIAISPPSLKIYHSVNKYSEQYSVPRHYVYRMLVEETRYMNPINNKYSPYQTSNKDAEGPAQVLLKTARWINNDYTISSYDIRYDVELNIRSSIKFIDWIRSTYDVDWIYVFGFYNTGYIKTNKYSYTIVNG